MFFQGEKGDAAYFLITGSVDLISHSKVIVEGQYNDELREVLKRYDVLDLDEDKAPCASSKNPKLALSPRYNPTVTQICSIRNLFYTLILRMHP
jgi:hypothetical protein